MDKTKKDIIPNKLYSLREAMDFIPWIKNVTTFRQRIQKDLTEDKGRKYQAIILKRDKYRLCYLKGASIIKLLEEHDSQKYSNPDYR